MCSQILEESMLEDINCLLGSGEVPNLFTPDEEADIVVRVRDAVRASGYPDTQVSGRGVATVVRTSLRSLLMESTKLHKVCNSFRRSRQFVVSSAPRRTSVQARCMALFTAHVRDSLHVVLCLDPAGASFRERVRNFPSLVNCRWLHCLCDITSPFASYPNIRGRETTHEAHKLHLIPGLYKK